MKRCRDFNALLPLYSGGELSEAENLEVKGHLARCAGCSDEEAKFSQVIGIARQVGSGEYRIPEAIANRIALEAAARPSRRPWGVPVPSFSLSAHPGLLAGAVAFVFVLAALPIAMRDVNRPIRQTAVSVLDITADGGVVRLAWSDGSRDSYRVYKSTDPRVLGQSEVHVVRGNVWTDNHAESSAIVYYRIE
jgi:anti-sigma factor RsiW